MQKQTFTPIQVQLAAAAGQRLLQEKNLPVPMEIAKGGALGALEHILTGIANGELIVQGAEKEGPQLTSVDKGEKG